MNIDLIVKEAVSASSNRLELWTAILSKLNAPRVCEVGVWKGDFSKEMLDGVPSISSYTLIDPWARLPDWNKPLNCSDAEFDEVREEALEKVAVHREKVVELRFTTKDAAQHIDDDTLDFTYIDGDHTLRGITIDLHKMLPKMRSSGLIGGDDFTKTIWQHDSSFSPTEVFPYTIYFAEAHDLKIYTLPFNQFLMTSDATGFEVVDHAGYSDLTPAQIYSLPYPKKRLRNRAGAVLRRLGL